MLVTFAAALVVLSSERVPSCETHDQPPLIRVELKTAIDGGLLRLKHAEGATFECIVPAVFGLGAISLQLPPAFADAPYNGVLEVLHLNHDKADIPIKSGEPVVVLAPFPIPAEVIVFWALIALFTLWLLTQAWRSSHVLAALAFLVVVYGWAAVATRVLFGHWHCGGSVFALLMPLGVLVATPIFVRSERAPTRSLAGLAATLSLVITPCSGLLPTRATELEAAQEQLYGYYAPASFAFAAFFLALPRFTKGANTRKLAGAALIVYFVVTVATALVEAHLRSTLADSCGG